MATEKMRWLNHMQMNGSVEVENEKEQHQHNGNPLNVNRNYIN